MKAIRLRYENRKFAPLDALPSWIKEGDEFTFEFMEVAGGATLLADSSVLARDGDSPEEDEAWKHL